MHAVLGQTHVWVTPASTTENFLGSFLFTDFYHIYQLDVFFLFSFPLHAFLFLFEFFKRSSCLEFLVTSEDIVLDLMRHLELNNSLVSELKEWTFIEILDSAEEFLARIDIEVDSPNPTPVIKSIGLQARTGIARIHAPKDLQVP